MGLYEIMFIVRPDLETEEHEEVLNGLQKTITENDGTVDKVTDWRRRRLAYEIDKHNEGHYYLVYFKGHGTIIPELEHFFKVNDAILRFLIGRVEEDYYEAAAAQEPEAEETLVPEQPEEEDEPAAAADAAQETGQDAGSDEGTEESAEPSEGESDAEKQPSDKTD